MPESQPDYGTDDADDVDPNYAAKCDTRHVHNKDPLPKKPAWGSSLAASGPV